MITQTLLLIGCINIIAVRYFSNHNKREWLTKTYTLLHFCWSHDDVIKWKHFPRYWPFVRGFTGHRWIPRTKASDAKLWCFLWSAPWINGCINNLEAGDLKRHLAHYDVTVMEIVFLLPLIWNHPTSKTTLRGCLFKEVPPYFVIVLILRMIKMWFVSKHSCISLTNRNGINQPWI